MQTPKAIAGLDAPPISGERTASALDLAAKLRQELLSARRRRSPINRPPAYRLVHHLGTGSARKQGAARTAQTPSQCAQEEPPATPEQYVRLSADEIRRLQRLTHMLTALSGELNVLLACCRLSGGEAAQ